MDIETRARNAAAWLAGVDRITWLVLAGAVAVVVLLFVAARLRSSSRGVAATRVTAFATLLGLLWSAQGMWDTAVHTYGQAVLVASVLFVVFESMMVSRMLHAHQYRHDRPRRARHVRAVWIIASVMAVVVALGEGWQQAPARLAIPLLVAYGWYIDLTSDDDPAERLQTSWIYTPRYIGLMLGLLRPGEADAQTIDRERLRDRMTTLAFRERYGATWASTLLCRRLRLARLATIAEPADLWEVADRLGRAQAVWRSRDEWDLIGRDEPEPEDSILSVRLPNGVMVDIDRDTEQVVGVGRTDPPSAPEPLEQPAPEVHPVAPEQDQPPVIVQPDKLPQRVPPADLPDNVVQLMPAPPAAPTKPGRTAVIDGREVTVPAGATVVEGRIVDGDELREIARECYRRSVRSGIPFSQRGLANWFNPPMSQPWARDRIAEVLAEAERVNGHEPDLTPVP